MEKKCWVCEGTGHHDTCPGCYGSGVTEQCERCGWEGQTLRDHPAEECLEAMTGLCDAYIKDVEEMGKFFAAFSRWQETHTGKAYRDLLASFRKMVDKGYVGRAISQQEEKEGGTS